MSDTIYRDDAIKCCRNEWEEEVEERLRLLPSAERKRGKWIVHYECPKCGEITNDFTEYCPFCNADMRGEEDEIN